ncbi:ATP synthase F0 [Colletotrichum cereale]|nr:ATP synthase F0 [Colletotrichum cereale]
MRTSVNGTNKQPSSCDPVSIPFNGDGASSRESSPLLQPHTPPHVSRPRPNATVATTWCTVLFIHVEIGLLLMVSPVNQILEGIICKETYPEPSTLAPVPVDTRCQDSIVQGELANLRGWANAFLTIPPLLTSIPYGNMADERGRKSVLLCSMIGLLLCTTCQFVVLLNPEVCPPFTLAFSGLFTFIGGGPSMVQAMVWTIVTDTVLVTNRARVFFRIVAIALAAELAVIPLPAYLLSLDVWIPMWLGYGFIVSGCLIALAVPETFRACPSTVVEAEHPLPTENGSTDSVEASPNAGLLSRRATISSPKSIGGAWCLISRSRSLLCLLLGLVTSNVVRYAKYDITLQYSTRRFQWTWETATYISTVGSLTNLVLLVLVLPTISSFLSTYIHLHPLARDLYLARISACLLALGNLLLGLATRPEPFTVALIVLSVGLVFNPLCRALLNTIVEPQSVATLNTAIAILDQLATLLCAPLLSGSLNQSFRIGGVWTGLIYIVMSALSAMAAVAVLLLNLA